MDFFIFIVIFLLLLFLKNAFTSAFNGGYENPVLAQIQDYLSKNPESYEEVKKNLNINKNDYLSFVMFLKNAFTEYKEIDHQSIPMGFYIEAVMQSLELQCLDFTIIKDKENIFKNLNRAAYVYAGYIKPDLYGPRFNYEDMKDSNQANLLNKYNIKWAKPY